MQLTDYNTIIWDWNGTLLDDAWLGVEIMNKMLIDRNMPGLTLERYREIFDFPVIDYYARLGFDFSREAFETVGQEFIEKYNERRYDCHLRPSARDILKKLKESGFRQFVLSARNHIHLDEEFEYHRIHQYFAHFSGLPDNWANGKIEHGLELIENQQIDTKKAVMIGDTVHDFEVAQALGVACILVEGGHQSAERIRKMETRIINGLNELYMDSNEC